MISLHIFSYLSSILHGSGIYFPDLLLRKLVPTATTITCTNADAFCQLNDLASQIKGFLLGLGVTAFFVGITVAAIMRMLAFGSERRIAMSNIALSAAIVGIIIIFLSTAILGILTKVFPGSPVTP